MRNSNRKISRTPISLKKYLPYIADSQRLSLLIEECSSTQNELKNMWKEISSKSTKNRKIFKNISKFTEKEMPNEIFKAENAKRKEKLEKIEKVKNQEISSVRKKIDSIIKSPKLNEKYNLERLNQVKSLDSNQKLFIEYEEIKSPEAKELLRVNKRNFGEYFQQELKFPSTKLVTSSTPVVSGSKSKNKSPKIQLKKKLQVATNGRNFSGTVSQMFYAYSKKKSLEKDEKEMLKNILKEKKNASERFHVQKFILEKYKKC